MTVKQYQQLEPIERFQIIIEKLKNNSYINDNGIEINIFSDYNEINKELLLFGITIKDKTIEEIFEEIVKEKNIRFPFWDKNNDMRKLSVLLNYMKHLGFYIYDYNIKEMPKYLQDSFKCYKEFNLFFKNSSLFV